MFEGTLFMEVKPNVVISYGVESIVFSGIVFRKCRVDIQEKRISVNRILDELCASEWCADTHFVLNDNILDSDLFTDGLHLVERGTVKLANNILQCINRNGN